MNLKKLAAAVLSLMLVISSLSMLTLPVSAASTEGYYTYKVTDGKATITDVDTAISGDITIPATLGGYPVTTIGDGAFAYCSSLTSVTIPDSVMSIGERAFYDCDSLKSITIPDRVTTIGKFAFSGCTGLTSITIPDSVTFIGDDAFRGCDSLTSITIGAGVTSIGNDAFSWCTGLTSITIPDSVTSIGSYTFRYCDSLTSVTIPAGVTSIGREAFYKCTALTDVYYAGTKTQWEAVSIGDYNDTLLNATIHYNSTGPNIPDDAVGYNDHCYKVYDDATTWEEARAYCIRLGGHLATVTSAGENQFLYNYIRNCGYDGAYFGLYEKSGEGDWQWCTGEEFAYANWADGEPNNEYSDESYGMFYFKFNDGKWNDGEYNDSTSAFICEWDVKGAISSSKQTVKVVNSAGEPIEGAQVAVTRTGATETLITNENGCVKFSKFTIGNLDFTVTADGYEPYTTVGKNYTPNENGVDVAILYTPEESGLMLTEAVYQDTDADYNEVIGIDVNLVKGTKRLSLSNSKRGHFRLLCATADTARAARYVLYQNGLVIATSDDGRFDLRIAQFEKGKNIYVTVVSNDGKRVSTPLNLEICGDELPKSASVSFGDKVSFRVPESIPFVGGSTLSCDIPDHPIQFEIEDGKVYVGLNVNFTEDKSMKEQYKELKETMDAVKRLSNYKVGKKLKGNITKFLKKQEKFKLPMAGDVDVKLFGGGEVTWSDSGLDTAKIEAYLLIDATLLEKNWQFSAWVIPVTVNLEIGLEGKVSATVDYNFKTQTLNGDFGLNLKPSVDVLGAVGVGKFIGVGAYGEAELEIDMQLLGTSTTTGINYVDLTGELGLKAYAGPLVYKKPFTHNTWHLYTRTDAVTYNLRRPLYYAGIYDGDNYTVGDVSYLSEQSEWLGDWMPTPHLFARRGNIQPLAVRPLQLGAYRNLQPSLAASDTHAIMTYIGADTAREAQNVPAVMTSVYDPATQTWSQPQQLDTDGTADAAPMIYADGDVIRIVYQDAAVAYGADMTAEEYCATQNIAVAVYDSESNAFVTEKIFETDGAYYRSPRLTDVNGTPALVWLAGDGTDLLGQGGNNRLLCATYQNGAWSEPQVLADDIGTVSDFAAGETDGQLTVLYAADADGSFVTQEDRTLVLADADSRETVYNGLASHVDFAKLPSETEETFMFVADEQLHTLNGPVCTVGSPESVTVADNKILFTMAADGRSEIYAAVYDEQTATYGAAVQLSEQETYIERLDSTRFMGNTVLVMTKKTVTVTDEDVTDHCDFAWALLNDSAAWTVDSVEYDHDDIENERLPLYVSVTNSGSAAADNCVIAIKNADGETVATQTTDKAIPAGATEDVVVFLPLEAITALAEFTVAVGEEVGAETDLTAFSVGYADLDVETEAIRVGNQNMLVCTVTNRGLSATGGQLTIGDIYGDEPLSTVDIGVLQPGERYTTVLDLIAVADENILTCTVSAEAEEYTAANNTQTAYFDFSTFVEAECQHAYDDDNDPDCNACGASRTDVTHIPGDINGDGSVNNRDVMILTRYLNEWNVETVEAALDVNGDGSVNNRDVMILTRYLNGWDVAIR